MKTCFNVRQTFYLIFSKIQSVIEMRIYVDEFIIKNFVMNCFILCLCGEMMQQRYLIKNVIMSSIIVTLISLLLVIYDIQNSLIIQMIVCIGMVELAFRCRQFQKILLLSVGVFTITFFIGGMLKANINSKLELIPLSIISFFTFYYYLKNYEKTKWQSRNTYLVEFAIKDMKIHLKSFLDTGNLMTSGIKEIPVIVVSEKAAFEKLPVHLAKSLIEGELLGIERSLFKNIRIVHYCGVDGVDKWQYGYQIKNVVISKEKVISVKTAVMIVVKQNFQNSDALIGINMLEGGFDNGNDTIIESKSAEILC